MTTQHSETIVSTRRIHEGRIVNLREDTVLMPSGRQASREIVEHIGAVAIVPLLADGRVAMVRQFRLTANQPLLEIPAGGLNRGEDPEACARRELIEECGLRGGTMTRLFSLFLAPGYSTELIHIYLAEKLEEVDATPEEDENLEIEKYPLEELLSMIDDGRVCDAKTVCALLAVAHRLKTSVRRATDTAR